MSAKVTTSGLREISAGVWDVEQTRRMGGINQRLRMTVVRLTGGGLWLYSPIEIDDRLAAEIATTGAVAHIVAPNKYHHLFAAAAKERYPAATLWAAPGLRERRPKIAFDRVVAGELPWQTDLDALVLTSVPRFNEAVFFHRASRTLVCADLLFNIKREDGFATRLLYRALGVYGRPAQSWYFRKSIDRRTAAPQLEAILAWNIGRICMSHGDVLDRDAKTTLAGVVRG
jgi:uncharacterized protein DUF4336